MRWLEVRRHSLTKKGAARGRGSHLSAEGVALARLVGESLGPFATVVTSASPRAIETAVAMGFAVDDALELPSGYVPGEVDHHEQWEWPHPYQTYAELLGHGGGIEPGLVACLPDADHESWGAPLGHCEGARLAFNEGRFVGARFSRMPAELLAAALRIGGSSIG
jgi:hypothetical protein